MRGLSARRDAPALVSKMQLSSAGAVPPGAPGGVEGFRLYEGPPNTQVATVWLQQSGEGHLREGRDQERLELGRCGVGNSGRCPRI